MKALKVLSVLCVVALGLGLAPAAQAAGWTAVSNIAHYGAEDWDVGSPAQVVVDDEDNVYIGNYGIANPVLKFDSDGDYDDGWGEVQYYGNNPGEIMRGITSMDIDNTSGYMYIVGYMSNSNRVVVLDELGEFAFEFDASVCLGTAGWPMLTVNQANGDVFVGRWGEQCRFESDGTVHSSQPADRGVYNASMVAGDGVLYLTDRYSAYMDVFSCELPDCATWTTLINGTYGTGDDQFRGLDAIDVDDDGNIYILDSFSTVARIV